MNKPSSSERKRGDEAKARLIERLRSQTPIDIGPWTRDELYEREEKRPEKNTDPPLRKPGATK